MFSPPINTVGSSYLNVFHLWIRLPEMENSACFSNCRFPDDSLSLYLLFIESAGARADCGVKSSWWFLTRWCWRLRGSAPCPGCGSRANCLSFCDIHPKPKNAQALFLPIVFCLPQYFWVWHQFSDGFRQSNYFLIKLIKMDLFY